MSSCRCDTFHCTQRYCRGKPTQNANNTYASLVLHERRVKTAVVLTADSDQERAVPELIYISVTLVVKIIGKWKTFVYRWA